MESFPLTANGKLDRKAFPDPQPTSDSFDTGAVVPRAQTMISYVADAIEAVRGSRPLMTSSFASIGVDSLGAVLFIRYLSDRLEGVHIEPSMLYAPKVTVQSFAADIWERLLHERPDLFIKLRISESGAPTGCDELPFDECDDNAGVAFEDLMVTNRRFLDGIRGVLTFMVRNHGLDLRLVNF